jgi:hypothetical protein
MVEKAKYDAHVRSQMTAMNRDVQTLKVAKLACLLAFNAKCRNGKSVDHILGLFMCASFKVVPWPMRLATSVSPPRHEFNHRPIHVGFVVDKGAMGQFFSQSALVSSVEITPVILHTHSFVTDAS